MFCAAGDAAQYVQDSAHGAADYASDAYDSAKESVKDAAEALSDYFSQYTTWAKKRADETTQASKDVSQVGFTWVQCCTAFSKRSTALSKRMCVSKHASHSVSDLVM